MNHPIPIRTDVACHIDAPRPAWRSKLNFDWRKTLSKTLGISFAMKKPSSSASLTLPLLAGSLAAAVAYAIIPRPKRYHPRQVAVVTGGSRGLGLAIAHRFAQAGLRLVLAARHQEELEAARQSILDASTGLQPADIKLVVCDLTDPEQARHLIEVTINTFGRIDLLINNAGIIEVGPFENQPLEAYDRAMQTNFFAALHTIHAATPYLLDPQDQSCRGIVNICSIGGKIPVPHLLPYVAAKFALTGFSEGLHTELRYKGVRVTTVCPGLMRSGGEEHAHFTGQQAKEERWFKLSAKTPGLSANVHHAAHRIYNAVQAGKAEITITPQAWLAARIVGIAPATSQVLAALANEYVLPDPIYTVPELPLPSALPTR